MTVKVQRLILTILITFGMFTTTRAEGVPYFKGTIYEALAQAQKQQKMLIIEFYAKWNYRSRWTNENVIAKKEVYTLIEKSFIIVKVDTQTTDGAMLAQQYQVKDYPSFVVFNSNGNVVDKIETTLDKQDFVARLGQILIGNDGKSGWELQKIFMAAEKDDKTQANNLTKNYLERVGKSKAITPAHWDLFANNSVTFYGSYSFEYIVDNRQEFDAVFEKADVEEVVKKALFEGIMPYSVGIANYDSVFLGTFTKKVLEINPIYCEALLQLGNLSGYRNAQDVDNYITTVRELVENVDEKYASRLIMSLDFVAQYGNKEQKSVARHIVDKHGRYTCSSSELVLVRALVEKLTE